MNKLTIREKILIYAAVMTAIFCGGFRLLHSPVHADYDHAKAVLREAELEKNAADMSAEREGELRFHLEKDETYIRENQEILYPWMEGADVETVLLEKFTGIGIQVIQIFIEEPEFFPFTEKEGGNDIGYYVVKVNLATEGDLMSLSSALEQIKADPAILTISFSIPVLEEKSVMELSAELYMTKEERIP